MKKAKKFCTFVSSLVWGGGSFTFPWAVLFSCAGSGSFWLRGRLFLPGLAVLLPACCWCWLLFTQPGVTSFLFCSLCFSVQTSSYCWSSIVLSSSSWNNTAGSWRSFKIKYPAGRCRWPLTPWMHLLFFIYIQYLSTVVICPLAKLHFSIIPPTCAWICMAWILFPLVVSRVVVSYQFSADCGASLRKMLKVLKSLKTFWLWIRIVILLKKVMGLFPSGNRIKSTYPWFAFLGVELLRIISKTRMSL